MIKKSDSLPIDLPRAAQMRLPASVQEIAEVIGTERALYLVSQLPRCCFKDRRWPGAESPHVILYVPKAIKPDHLLVRILGWTDASRMVKAFGGEILQPATCAGLYRQFRDQAIVRLVAEEGASAAMAAEWFDVSERHVRNLLRDGSPAEQRAANEPGPGAENPQEERRAVTGNNVRVNPRRA